tara:strand:- start:261 stop:557 length:297 start_codon:yes stop_codon:yes gene_type:complete
MNHQILQLQPPIPVVTPMGDAIAHLIIDYSIEHSIHWVVFMEDTGQCWTLPNEKIRAQRNITLGRMNPEKPEQISLKELLMKEGPSFSENDEDKENPS